MPIRKPGNKETWMARGFMAPWFDLRGERGSDP